MDHFSGQNGNSHDIRLLGDAVKLLLDENDASSLSVLVSRLAPFRIDWKETSLGGTLSLKPVLVFEHGLNACPNTSHQSFNNCHGAQNDVIAPALSFSSSNASTNMYTEPTIPSTDFSMTPLQRFVDNTSLSQRADACPSNHGFLEGNRSFGADNAHNGGLNDGMNLFSDSNSVIAGSLGSEAFSQDAPSLEVETPQKVNQQHQSRSSSTCYALNDFSMLDHRVPLHQPTQEPTWQPQSFGSNNSLVQLHQFSVQSGNTPILNLTPTSATEYHQPLAGETAHGSPDSSRSDVDGDSTKAKNEKTRRTLSDVTSVCRVTSMVKTCLRPDYRQFLQANLPRWVRNGLWHNNWSSSADEGTRSDRFANLQRVYSCFCQLDVRMKDDSIRSRMVMVLLHLEFEKMYHDWKCGKVALLEPMTSMGRGNISAVIDQILEKAHPEWSLAEPKQKAEFRAKFHNRKRHGKRWWMLMDTLGPSILLLCSSRFAGAMKNTTVTASMIRELPAAIRDSAPKVTQVFNVVNPIAKSLFYDRGHENFAVDKVLAQLGALEAGAD